MARVKFTKDYLHRWPSRSSSQFRANGGAENDGVYTVKKDVAERAIEKGYATEVTERATRPDREKASRQDPDPVAESDHAQDRDDARTDELQPDDDDRGSDGVPPVSDAG